MESALSIKGQATILKFIREHLHLEPGDRIRFFVHPNGSVAILPKISTSRLKGSVPPPRRKVRIKDMNSAAAEGVVLRTRQAKRG